MRLSEWAERPVTRGVVPCHGHLFKRSAKLRVGSNPPAKMLPGLLGEIRGGSKQAPCGQEQQEECREKTDDVAGPFIKQRTYDGEKPNSKDQREEGRKPKAGGKLTRSP